MGVYKNKISTPPTLLQENGNLSYHYHVEHSSRWICPDNVLCTGVHTHWCFELMLDMHPINSWDGLTSGQPYLTLSHNMCFFLTGCHSHHQAHYTYIYIYTPLIQVTLTEAGNMSHYSNTSLKSKIQPASFKYGLQHDTYVKCGEYPVLSLSRTQSHHHQCRLTNESKHERTQVSASSQSSWDNPEIQSSRGGLNIKNLLLLLLLLLLSYSRLGKRERTFGNNLDVFTDGMSLLHNQHRQSIEEKSKQLLL